MGLLRLNRGEIDLVRLRVVRDGSVETLTAMEARLLAYLAEKPGRAVDQDELLREVWGYSPNVRSRTVETTVGRLRVKIEDDPTEPRHLLTVRGLGYQLVLAAPETALLSDDEVRAQLGELGADDALVAAIEGSRRAAAHVLKWAPELSRRDLLAGLALAPLDDVAVPSADHAALIALSGIVGSFDVAEAGQALGGGPILETIASLRARGLLRADGDRFVVPGLVRAAVLERQIAASADGGAAAVLAAAPAWLARGPWGRLEAFAEAALARCADPERARLWGLLARVRLWSGRTDAAEAAAEHAMRSDAPDALLAAAEVIHARGRSGSATLRDLATRARAGDDREAGVAERLLALAERYDGALDEAARRLQESARLCRRAGDRGELADTLRQTALLYRLRGDATEALRHVEGARAHAPGDTRRLALIDEATGTVLAELSRTDLAVEALERARRAHATLGARRREVHVLLGLGDLYVGSGQPEAAEPLLREALAAVLDVVDARVEGALRQTAARAAYDRGRFEEALRLAEAAARTFAELGDPLHRAVALQVAAQAAHAGGDLPSALRMYEEAAGPLAGTFFEVSTLAGWVLALRAAGQDAAGTMERLDRAARGVDRRVLNALRAPPRDAMALLRAGSRDERALLSLLDRPQR